MSIVKNEEEMYEAVTANIRNNGGRSDDDG